MFLIYLNGELRGSAVYAEDAAAFVAFLGNDAQVRDDKGWILWWEGDEKQPAAASYDGAAEIIHARMASDHRPLDVSALVPKSLRTRR